MKNFDSIMLIEFSAFEGDMVAIFNETVISEVKVREFIKNAKFYNPNIIVCSKAQWKNVFGFLTSRGEC